MRELRAIPQDGITGTGNTPDGFRFDLVGDGESHARDKMQAYKLVYGTTEWTFELVSWDEPMEYNCYNNDTIYEDDFDELVEFDCLVDDVMDLTPLEKDQVWFLLEDGSVTVQVAYDSREDVHLHEGGLEEYAKFLLFESGTCEVPCYLADYIDVKKFARDLGYGAYQYEWEGVYGLYVVEAN